MRELHILEPTRDHQSDQNSWMERMQSGSTCKTKNLESHRYSRDLQNNHPCYYFDHSTTSTRRWNPQQRLGQAVDFQFVLVCSMLSLPFLHGNPRQPAQESTTSQFWDNVLVIQSSKRKEHTYSTENLHKAARETLALRRFSLNHSHFSACLQKVVPLSTSRL